MLLINIGNKLKYMERKINISKPYRSVKLYLDDIKKICKIAEDGGFSDIKFETKKYNFSKDDIDKTDFDSDCDELQMIRINDSVVTIFCYHGLDVDVLDNSSLNLGVANKIV